QIESILRLSREARDTHTHTQTHTHTHTHRPPLTSSSPMSTSHHFPRLMYVKPRIIARHYNGAHLVFAPSGSPAGSTGGVKCYSHTSGGQPRLRRRLQRTPLR